MPMNIETNELEHAPAKSSDPAHGSSENTNHTTKSGEKPTTAFEALTDPSFFPTLEKAPFAQRVKSYLFLLFLVFGAVTTLWLFGFELFQTKPAAVEIPLAVPGTEGGPAGSLVEIMVKEVAPMTVGASALIMVLLYSTGTANIDFWSLVVEYGWWTLPLVGAMGLLFVMMEENTESIGEVS